MRSTILVLLVLVIAADVAVSQCEPGYSTPDNRICYKGYTSRKTWADAASQCAQDGGYLASIPSSYNENYIRSMMPKAVGTGSLSKWWLGINCSSNSTSSCQNAVGTPLGPYSPYGWLSSSTITPGCVYEQYASSYWDTDGCGSQKYFVCELPLGNICPPGYAVYFDKCFALGRNVTSLDVAETICQKDKGHLASIHSQTENDFLYTLAASQAPKDYSLVGIGLRINNWSNKQEWIDGTTFDFNNTGYTNPAMGSCYGLAMKKVFAPQKTWSSIGCDSQMPYICEIKHLMPNTTVLAPLQCDSMNANLPSSGVIYSPGYPLPYVRSDCMYYITVPLDKIVQASFPVLNLANGTTITIYNDYAGGTPLANITSASTPSSVGSIRSLHNQMAIFFKSNSDVAELATKWVMQYQPGFK